MNAFVCEKKVASQRFIEDNWGKEIGHIFTSLESLVTCRGKCTLHNGVCSLPDNLVIDCLFTGTPCQAWTRQRDRKGGAAPGQHPGWKCTFGLLMDLLDAPWVDVRGGVSEQVLGFADPDNRSSDESLKGESSAFMLFVAELRRRGYKVCAQRLRMSHWLSEPERERLYIFWMKESLGGADALQWIEKSMKELPACYVFAVVPVEQSC